MEAKTVVPTMVESRYYNAAHQLIGRDSVEGKAGGGMVITSTAIHLYRDEGEPMATPSDLKTGMGGIGPFYSSPPAWGDPVKTDSELR